MSGTLFLIGTGPGDPELLTLKAARLLGSAAVIAYPQKPGENSRAFQIAKEHLQKTAILLPADIPMRTERDPAQKAYDGLADAIIAHLNEGRDVAYLCEGDPLFYGSAMYMIDRVSHHADVTIVPGISSLTATAAAIARPLAARNEVLKVLPGPLDNDTLRAELAGAEAVAIIKIGRHFDRIRDLLIETGHADKAMIIENATGDDQCITPLTAFTGKERPYFATILCYKGAEPWGR